MTTVPEVSQRFDALASKLMEQARLHAGRLHAATPAALESDYWKSVQELFTRDVTSRGLQELVEQDAAEAWRFFTREVDLVSLARRPWYERYPLAAWRVFLAMAYRLSPARRIVFAVAVPLLWLGLLWYLVRAPLRGDVALFSGPTWLLLAGVALLALLLLELRDKLSLKGDLEIARQIQFGLLPFEPVARGSFRIHSAMRPANTVGGDYFDVIDLGAGRLALAVGDVAGKGIPAALLMALLQGSLRTLITAGLRGTELVAKLNAHLAAHIPSNRLVTFFYAELELDSGRLASVNAGHNAPFVLRRDGTLERIGPTGMALGVVAATEFALAEHELAVGEQLLLFTDGVTEAWNAREVEYGEERLGEFARARRELPQPALIDAVIADVLDYCGSSRPRDDMTLMLVRRV